MLEEFRCAPAGGAMKKRFRFEQVLCGIGREDFEGFIPSPQLKNRLWVEQSLYGIETKET